MFQLAKLPLKDPECPAAVWSEVTSITDRMLECLSRYVLTVMASSLVLRVPHGNIIMLSCWSPSSNNATWAMSKINWNFDAIFML